MFTITALPSINDCDLTIHKPNWFDRILHSYGYIEAFSNPIARRSRITGLVELRKYNETFQYWGWMEVNDKYKPCFRKMKYWQ